MSKTARTPDRTKDKNERTCEQREQ